MSTVQTATAKFQATSNMDKITDKESLRWSLSNVQLVKHGGDSYLRATDARAAAAVRTNLDCDLNELNVLVPAKVFPGAGKDRRIVVDIESREAKGPKTYERLGDGRMPKLGQVMPDKLPGGCVVTIDAHLLSKLAEALSSNKKEGKVTLFIENDGDTNKPIVVLASERDECQGFGVIMPCSDSETKHKDYATDYESFVAVQRKLDDIDPTI